MSPLITKPTLDWEDAPGSPNTWRAFNGVDYIYVREVDGRYAITSGMTHSDLEDAQAWCESLALGTAKTIVEYFKERKRKAKER